MAKKSNLNETHKGANNAKSCKDCGKDDEEKCLLCEKNKHICETEINVKENRDHTWIWLCGECDETIKKEEVIKEM